MQKERNNTIDILRGIAIFLVVFGHVTHVPELRTYIWGFHIPIFFFISGLLFYREKFTGFVDFLKRRSKGLLVPFAVFYLLTFCYWVLIERHTRGADVEIWTQLVGMVYGTYSMDWMMFNGALWFIPCLFSMEMMYWFVSKIGNRWLRIGVLLGFYAVGICLKDVAGWIPFGICAAFIGVIYYGVGDLCKPVLGQGASKEQSTIISKEKITTNHIANSSTLTSTLISLSLLFVLFVVQMVMMPYTGADLAGLLVTNVWLYIPVSLVGVALYWCLASLMNDVKGFRYFGGSKNINVIEWLGVNSLVIFALQEPIYRAVIFVTSKLTGYETEMVRNNVVMCFCISVVTILIITPAVYLWNKYGKTITS